MKPTPSEEERGVHTEVAVDGRRFGWEGAVWEADLKAKVEPEDLPAAVSPLEGYTMEWARAHRERMSILIRTDPERALQERVTLAIREELPEEVRRELPELVMGRGDFEVMAVCTHLPHEQESENGHAVWEHEIRRQVVMSDRVYTAHVYGRRQRAVTTEQTSIFGVAVGDQMALHEEEIVELADVSTTLVGPHPVSGNPVRDETGMEVVESSSPPFKVAAYAGEVVRFATEEAYTDWVQQKEADPNEGRPLAAGVEFTPGTPPTTDSNPPVDTYVNEWTGTHSWELGPKTVFVFVVKPSDGTGYTPGSEPTHDSLINGLDQSSAWYYQQSFKQTWFGNKTDEHGDLYRLVVTPELDLPGTVLGYRDFGGSLFSHAKSAAEALGPEYTNNGSKDPDRFDRWVIMCKDKLIDSTGLAYVGGKGSWVGSSLAGGVATHEWGHNWGLFHENYWDGDNDIARNGYGQHSEYGETGGNFNEMSKYKIDWLTTADGDIEFLSSNGSYTRRLFDYGDLEADKAATRLRAIGIPITNTFSDYLTLGFRHASNKTDGGDSRADRERNGLQLHSDGTSIEDSGWNSGTHFIDATPGSRPEQGNQDQNDGILLVGMTYSEPANLNGTNNQEIHVTPIGRGQLSDGGRTHEWIDVVVNLGDFSANQPPVASINTSHANIAAGTSASLTAVASDPDGDDLAYAWTISDGRYSYDNSTAFSAVFSDPGLYEVVLTVTDMKGGTATAVQWVNVGSQPDYAPNPPAASLTGIDYRYYEVSASAVPTFDQLLPISTGTLSSLSLSPKQRTDDIAFLFEGYIEIPTSEIYTFTLTAEDGAVLDVAGQRVVDNDSLKSFAEEAEGSISLQAGLHPFRIGFFHKSGSEILKLEWRAVTATGNQREPVPTSNLFRVDPASVAGPVVSITTPTQGESFPLDASVTLEASASDADGVAKVVYFVNGGYVGESTSAPYSVSWDELILGDHEVKAVAYDLYGTWTESAPIQITIENEFRNFIGLNIVGSTNTSEGHLASGETAGAVYAGGNWNNVVDTELNNTGDPETLEGSESGLVDTSGNAVATVLDWDVRVGKSTGQTYGENASDFSTPNGKLMRGFSGDRDSGSYAEYDVLGIPYLEYEVYVYFDHRENRSGDINPSQYDLIPSQGPAPSSLFGKVSRTRNDSIGDYPNYDTWTGFKEATATSSSAPNSEVLGNYIVFRNQTAPSTRLMTSRITSGVDFPSVAAIQIVESPTTIARAVISESGNRTDVTEQGGSDILEVRLSLPPDNGSVAVRITPDADLSVSPQVLVFDVGNYDLVQTVQVYAVDDSEVEGTHSGSLTFSVTGLENYSSVPDLDLDVEVSDNDQFTVTVDTVDASEEGPTAGAFYVSRSQGTTMGDPLAVSFTLSGVAETDGTDYAVSGTGVSYNPVTATGTATIAANAASVGILISPVDDALQEGAERVEITLGSVSAHVLETPSASLDIVDDDAPVYYAQHFDDGLIWGSDGGAQTLDDAFDLNNKKLTFTPDGSPGFYAMTLSDAASFEEDTSGHTQYLPTNYWNDLYISGTSVRYFGNVYDKVTIETWGSLVIDSHTSAPYASLDPGSTYYLFQRRQIAFFSGTWLAPTDANGNGNTAGTIHYHRAADRFILTFTGVAIGTGGTLSCQMVLRDDGIITMTYLNTTYTGSSGITMGLSNLTEAVNNSDPPEVAMLPGFTEFNFSEGAATGSSNASPSFGTVPDILTETGSGYTYVAAVSDPDGDSVTLTAPTTPAWLTFTPGVNNGSLSGTPPAAGSYSVVLEADDGINPVVQQSFTLTVTDPVLSSGPVIVSQPQNQVRPYHGSAGFVVVETGDQPMSYQWRKNGTPINDSAKYTGTDSATLTVNWLEESDEGSFDVILNNGIGGDVISSSATLTVDAPIAPTITDHPTGGTITEGDNITLQVVAEGSPDLEYQWYVQGNPLQDGGEISGATTAALTITEASAGDGGASVGNNGTYTVEVSNDGGSVISLGAVLTVEELVIHAPSALVATDVSESRIDLTWTDNADNETGYKIQRSDNPGGPWITVFTGAADLESYSDESLSPETTYYYQVVPFRNSIDGPASSVASATTQSEPVITANLIYHFDFDANSGAGTTVNDVSGFGTAAHASGLVNSSPADLFENANNPGEGYGGDFTASRSNMTFHQAKFNSQVAGVSNAFTVIWTMDLTGITSKGVESQSFVEVTNSSDGLRISASNTNLSSLRFNLQVGGTTATTSTGLDVTSPIVIAVAYDADTDEVQVFAGSDYQNVDLHETVSLSKSSIADLSSVIRFGDTSSGSPRGYYDDIRFYDQALNRTSIRAIDAPATVPLAPSGLTVAAVAEDQIDLSWNDNSEDETGFKIERSDTGGGNGFSLIHSTGPDVTSYSDTGRSPGTTYFYRVKAANLAGDSAPASEGSATTWTVQQQYFADSGLAHDVDPTADSDGDGLSNEDEEEAGTNPNLGSSVFRTELAGPLSGSFSFQYPSVSGKYYRVFYRTSLVSGDWQVLPGHENVTGTGSEIQVEDTPPGPRFYKVEVKRNDW